MITRTVWIKVSVFFVVTILGVGYVLVHYLGAARGVFGDDYTAYADLNDSGGLFTGASVTYRGVEVGRVGEIRLRGDGIRIALDMNGSRHIPADTRAVVGNGSAIGEQYIDLQPRTNSGPYLHQGSVVHRSDTRIPVSTQELLVSVDKLVNSLPRRQLRTMVTELGATFDGTGDDLRRLLDSSDKVLRTAQAHLPQTLDLIRKSVPVLRTQASLRGDVASFSQHLSSFSDQLRASDKDLRLTLHDGTPAARQLSKLVRGLDTSLPLMMSNLADFGGPVHKRIAALRQVLLGYPYVIATTFGIFPGHGVRFGVPIYGDNQVPACSKGFIPPSKHRLATATQYPGLRWDAFCSESTKSDVGVRGARMAPEPGGGRLGDTPGYRNSEGLPHNGSYAEGQRSYSDTTATPGQARWM